MHRKSLFFSFIGLTLAACTQSMEIKAPVPDNTPAVERAPNRVILEGVVYGLKTVNGQPVQSSKNIELTWNTHQEMRFTICNRASATLAMPAMGVTSTIQTDKVLSSRMACTDENLDALERSLFNGLRDGLQAKRVQVTPFTETLTFVFADGGQWVFESIARYME
jgi:heat shock protein HslJ